MHDRENLIRHLKVRRGDPRPTAPVTASVEIEVGMQDQAFLGPESGLAVPGEDGGVDLYVATQWLHVDQRQVQQALGLPAEKVRLTLSGVGGAFGGREDLSMHVHACLLAMHTGRPVKMSYGREESFFGHVHRHPASLRYEFGAERDGRLVYARCELLFDGGAYASSTSAVVGNGGTMAVGPYRVPNVHVDAYGVYTNNPPCGAMRGFGCVQAAFAHEAVMDALAAELGMDPVELRRLNALEEGDTNITGQVIDSAAPVAELLQIVRDLPLPPPREESDAPDLRSMPGGVSNTTHGEGVRRGIGYGVSLKNVGFSEGFDDYSTARVRLEVVAGEPVASVHTAAAEVGQGLITVEQQICRTELGVERVVIHPKDTRVGSGGSTSASRQTYVTGGAVKAACEAVRAVVLEKASRRTGLPAATLELRGAEIVSPTGEVVADLGELLGDDAVDETVEWRHRPTYPVDPETGQGSAHVQYAFSAHRAVVDVDVELGLVKVVALDTAQDVGRAINADAVVGQIQGGSTQGMGLALMEEVVVVDGRMQEPLVHRLPDPHDPRRPADAGPGPRVRRPARPVRPARRRRATDHLLGPGGRRRDPPGERGRAAPGPGPAGAHHRGRCDAVTGIELAGPAVERSAEVLTPEALEFVADLHRTLRAAARRAAGGAAGRAATRSPAPGGSTSCRRPRTSAQADWTVAPAPADLRDRRVEITGPTERKMTINALNSGAKVWLADLEDANTPHWAQRRRRAR